MIVADLENCPIGMSVLNPAVTAAGATQATATQLDAFTSIVTTVSPGAGVQIVRPAKYRQIVVNLGANALNVWPRSNMALFPSATNVAVVVQPGMTLGLVVFNDQQAFCIFNTASFG